MKTEPLQSTAVTTATPKALSQKTIEFLEARGLDPELAAHLNLSSYARNGAEYLVFDYGASHTKARNLEDKHDCFIQGGGNLPLFNAPVVADTSLDQPLLITEGEFDCLAAIQSGHTRSVSVPNGAKALSDDNINYILDHVDDSEDIIIAADNDSDGMGMLSELSARLGKSRCKYLIYPRVSPDSSERCKDLNETLQRYPSGAVPKVISNAKYVAVPGLATMSQLPEIPPKKLYDIGINGLSKVKIRLGEWSVFTGIPGHGKSTFMTEWAGHMRQNYGWKTLFASFEHPPQEDHKENLQRWYLQGNPAFATAERLQEANQWIDDSFTFCFPDYEQDVSIDWLFEVIETSVKRYGTKLVIIDPWNMIDHENNEMELSGTKYVAACLREFRRMAYKLNIHLCIVAHPTKMGLDGNEKYRVPNLYNISDSANWNAMCNIGFIIYRDDLDDTTLLRVEKCKYGSKIGLKNREDFSLKFDVETNRYREHMTDDDIKYSKDV